MGQVTNWFVGAQQNNDNNFGQMFMYIRQGEEKLLNVIEHTKA